MHNLALPVETVIQNVVDSVNIDVLCNVLAKQALQVRGGGRARPPPPPLDPLPISLFLSMPPLSNLLPRARDERYG